MIRVLPLLFSTLAILANSTASADDEKEKVPAAELSQSLADVKALFGDRFTKAKNIRSIADRRKALAALVDEILETHASTIATSDCYALLQVARQIAVQGQDFATALDIIETTDKGFQIDSLQMKAAALINISGKFRDPGDHAAIMPSFVRVLNDAVQSDRFDLAPALSDATVSSARQTRDRKLLEQVRERADQIERITAEFESYKKAIAKLNHVPDDADANLIAGRYVCVYKGDWTAGVSHLALGSDKQLREVAAADMVETTTPTGTTAQLEIADLWWKIADGAEGAEQQAFRTRARDWYKKALPKLSEGGLAYRRVMSRVEEPQVELEGQPENELPKFAKSFIGKYIYTAEDKASAEPIYVVWEFQDDKKVTENGIPIAQWSVADRSRIKVDPDGADEEPFLVSPRGAKPATGSRQSNGNTWRWRLTRLDAKKWEHKTESVKIFGREIDGGTEILTFYSNGRVNDPLGKITWKVEGNSLTIGWGSNKKTEATLGPGGRTYTGKTRQPTGFRRTRISLPVSGRLVVDTDAAGR